jgi:hypothetical protein
LEGAAIHIILVLHMMGTVEFIITGVAAVVAFSEPAMLLLARAVLLCGVAGAAAVAQQAQA